MARSKSPAYQHYPADELSDSDIIALTLEEYGCLKWLEDHLWLKEFLEYDEKKLSKILKISPKKFRKVFSAIEIFFKIENGKIRSPKLDEERQKQAEWRLKSSAGGKESVRKRREKVKGGSEVVQRVVEPKLNSSTSSSTSNKPSTPFETKNSNGNGVSDKNGIGEMGGSKFCEVERRKYAESQTEINDVDAYVNSVRSRRGDFDKRVQKWMAENCSNCRAYNSDRHSGCPSVPPCLKHSDESFEDWKNRFIARKKRECRDCRSYSDCPDESPKCEKHGDEEKLNRNFQSFITENLKIRGLDSADYFSTVNFSRLAVGKPEFVLSMR